MATKARKLIYSLVPVVTLLAGAELVARIAGPPPGHMADHLGGSAPSHMLLDPGIGWRLKPGEPVLDPDYAMWADRWGLVQPAPGEVPINARGLRDDEITVPASAGTKRVWVMGDSSVFGNGVPRPETFSERLEDQLTAQRGQPVDVINAGTSGYSSFQALALLERNLDTRPDVVLAYLMNSNLMEFRGSPDSIWFKRWVGPVDLTVLSRSVALRWASWWRRYYLPFQKSEDGMLLRVRVEDFRDNLRRVVQLGRRHAFTPVFVIPAVESDLTHPESASDYTPADDADLKRLDAMVATAEAAEHWTGQTRLHFRAAVYLEARRAGVAVVDGGQVLATAFETEPQRYVDADYLFVDQIHPSSQGHRLLAQALLPVVDQALGD